MDGADGPRLVFFDDPAAFLDRAGGHLAQDPLLNTVLVAVTQRAVAEDAAGVPVDPALPRWWAVAEDGAGAITGVAMRTAPGAPYPLYVLPMPDPAAATLARALVGRGEATTAVNGTLPAARVCAEELAVLTGGRVRVTLHTRLFELPAVVAPPRRPPGRLRAADPGDAELTLRWFDAFLADADEQAGRPRGSTPEISEHTLDEVLRRIEGGTVWLWVDEHGTPVHLTAANPPGYGVARIGPVYTPAERRGRGYASAAVAEVSQMLLDAGVRPCLFTDQANPTSNAIYEAIGYRPVVDTVSLVVDPMST